VDSGHGKNKGMVLPFEPHSITFDEIVYSVDMPQVNHSPCYKFSIWVYSRDSILTLLQPEKKNGFLTPLISTCRK